MIQDGTAFLVRSTLLAVQLLSQGCSLFSELLESVKGEGSIELHMIFLLDNLGASRRKSMKYCWFFLLYLDSVLEPVTAGKLSQGCLNTLGESTCLREVTLLFVWKLAKAPCRGAGKYKMCS